jgi:hypothetical protein
MVIDHYLVLARVCIRWQDSERAELEADRIPDQVAAAIDADRHIGFTGGGPAPIMMLTGGPSVMVNIGGVEYLAFDIVIDVLYKR